MHTFTKYLLRSTTALCTVIHVLKILWGMSSCGGFWQASGLKQAAVTTIFFVDFDHEAATYWTGKYSAPWKFMQLTCKALPMLSCMSKCQPVSHTDAKSQRKKTNILIRVSLKTECSVSISNHKQQYKSSESNMKIKKWIWLVMNKVGLCDKRVKE